MRTTKLGRKVLMIALGALLALGMAVPAAYANPSSPSPEELGGLSAEWWQWALKKPTHVNPLVGSYEGGAQCAGGGAGNVWFLAGSFTGEDVTRYCHVPANKWIFFPIVNVECSQAEGNGSTDAELRECATGIMDQVLEGEGTTLYATVDGESVLDQGVRVQSPLFRWHVPKNNVFEVIGAEIPPGQTIAVSDGVYVLLAPLERGTHTISFGGDFPSFGFTQNNTYILTVKGKPAA